MSIKRKFDLIILLFIALFLVSLVITYSVTKNMENKTSELVNLSKELDFLTNLRTTILNLSYSVNEYLKYNDEKTRIHIEEGIKNLHRIVAKARIMSLDEDEEKLVSYLINNVSRFERLLNKILFSNSKADKTLAHEALQVELFSRALQEIDKHWYEDFDKIYRAQVESERAQTFVFHFYVALLVFLLLAFFLIRKLIKRNFVLPIITLSQRSFKMATGDLSQRLSIKSGDELEELGNNFNLMAEALAEKINDLEAYVKKEQKLIRELSILTEFIGYVVSEKDVELLFKRLVER
ncbi:MAG: HAMP domain-containing protein, partial [Nitrospirae bacterium]